MATRDEFNGTTAFVTGGGSGIGRASAIELAARGCLVTVGGRTEESLKETVALIEAVGGEARHAVCDVRDEQSVQAAVEAAIGDLGRLDFAVNSAGVSHGGNKTALADYDTASFDRDIAVNLRGIFLCMKYEIRQMLIQSRGSIVNVSSMLGLMGSPGSSGYVSAKHGQLGLTKSAALDYATHGIRINAVCPGTIDTPMIAIRTPELMTGYFDKTPMHRMGRPEEVAEAVAWLCSESSSFVTGAGLSVDGGVTASL